LGAVLIATAVVASCGNQVHTKPKGEGPMNVGGADIRNSAVLVGWQASLDAFDEAARTMNWRSPALAATHVEPQLGIAVRNLWLQHWAHYIAVGHDSVLWTEVVNTSDKRATVIACIDENEIAVFSSTHRPVPGIAGERERTEATATMTNTSTGWKLERQLWKTPCPAR
jgi:hypothetical protein